jgi:NAD(P)-dependent dehydrogenase (short-subunit alcohol dehydrogenase family)
MGEFDGLVAAVTGGASGIGAAVAEELEAQGARVAVLDLEPDGGPHALALRADVSDDASVRAAVDRVVADLGRLDVLVNNAGIGIGAAIGETETKRMDIQLDVNLRSIVLFYRECVDLLRAAGAEHRNAHVFNTASIAGKTGQAWLSIYSATKHAVVGFTQSMNKELGTEGIKSCALCPGFVDTAMTDFVKEQVPPEEMIRPADIGEMVRALLRLSPACVVPEIVFQRPDEVL